MHGLDNQPSVLRRWAAQSPDTPLPRDWTEFRRSNLELALTIEKKDPQLVSLLDGTAPAGLRADVLQGKFSHNTPSPVSEAQQKHDKVRELVASKPWADGQVKNLTAALMLEDLDPEVAKSERRKAGYASPQDRDAEVIAQRSASAEFFRRAEYEGLQRRMNELLRSR